MSLQQRMHAHVAGHVERKTALLTFVTSVGVLLVTLLIGACLLVALVMFYGLGTDAFVTRVSPDAVTRLKFFGILLAAVGGVSLLGFILGSVMLVGALNQARYRAIYLWFAVITGVLAAAVFLRVQSY